MRAWSVWTESGGITHGPLFRPVTRHGPPAARQAVDPLRRSGRRRPGPLEVFRHSLRAGFLTSAAAAHAEERLIQLQTGHRSLPTVRGYIRDGRLFHGNAAAFGGL